MVIARRGLFTLVVEAQWLYSGNQKTPLTVKVIYWYLTPVSVFTQKVKQNQVLAIEIINIRLRLGLRRIIMSRRPE
jgi:hypothetical protein